MAAHYLSRRHRRWLFGFVIAANIFALFVVYLRTTALETSSPDAAAALVPAPPSPCYARAIGNPLYPRCQEKIDWLRQFWTSHSCYAAHGIQDGDDCSIVDYLSRVEHHCPKPSNTTDEIVRAAPIIRNHPEALDRLFALMSDNPTNYEWIKGRISRLYANWSSSMNEFISRSPELFERRRLTVIIYMGFLSRETGLKFGEKSSSGGPLGELVQWADLIASLHVLGHNLIIASEYTHFSSSVVTRFGHTAKYPCPNDSFDLLFTDIIGLRKMRFKQKVFYANSMCRVRLLDSFGTHAEFNHMGYFKEHWKKLGNKKKNPWGGFGLQLGQFLTMYPHTDDNTFLGFVVEVFDAPTGDQVEKRENITLVYGKEVYMWNDSGIPLETAAKYTKIHATVADKEDVGEDIVNHGLLGGKEFHALLRRAKIFLGLGFPLEGPAPLEAVANGAIFINHRFEPPKSRLTYKFFEEKPTLRELNSQNPYMERFIGEPNVITVDVFNQTALDEAYKKALNLQPEPLLPTEFSFIGMLERVDVIISKHNYCAEPTYPPWSAATVILADQGSSCQDACASRGLVCERSFFSKINDAQFILKTLNSSSCQVDSFTTVLDPLAPTECMLQADSLLFSCATKPPRDASGPRRICPCRRFRKGQIVVID